MAAALLLGFATIATLATFSSGQTAPNWAACPPCNKMMAPTCAKDADGKVKTFANPCLIDFCNCLLKLAKKERVFNQTYNGICKETETTVPECFMEGNATSSTAAGNLTTTESTSSGSSGTSGSTVSSGTTGSTGSSGTTGTTGTSSPTPGGRSSNTTTEVPPGGAPGLKSMLLTLALPLAALLVFL